MLKTCLIAAMFGLRCRMYRILNRSLTEFGYNMHSQNGEDGIIEELLHRLGIRGGWVVEFGAWDGIRFSNTYWLLVRQRRYRGVYIEGDHERYKNLVSNVARFDGRVSSICKYIQPQGDSSLQVILHMTSLPYDFEILSIDVDGIDYHIWDHFGGYSPKVVVIEVNSSIPPNVEQVHGQGCQGSSFLSMLELGRRKGYTCVCHTGNMFFVRNDLLEKVGIQRRYLSDPELLFCGSWLWDQRPKP